MNIWVKKEQEDKIMQRIGLDKNWDFYESDESMSFVFATPPSQKVDLPHDFMIRTKRTADSLSQGISPGQHLITWVKAV